MLLILLLDRSSADAGADTGSDVNVCSCTDAGVQACICKDGIYERLYELADVLILDGNVVRSYEPSSCP
jgi:hypothetical protein